MIRSFGIPHTNERNHFCHTEYPGNYVAHFLAVKQAHPNITLVANCDLSNLDNEVSFPHKVCAPQRCGQTCAAIALSGLGSRPGSAQRSAAPRRWVACAAHRAAHSIARTRALSCAVSLHGPSLTHANTPSHRQVGTPPFRCILATTSRQCLCRTQRRCPESKWSCGTSTRTRAQTGSFSKRIWRYAPCPHLAAWSVGPPRASTSGTASPWPLNADMIKTLQLEG